MFPVKCSSSCQSFIACLDFLLLPIGQLFPFLIPYRWLCEAEKHFACQCFYAVALTFIMVLQYKEMHFWHDYCAGVADTDCWFITEWDLGGFPAWLLAMNPSPNLRSSESTFLQLVWFSYRVQLQNIIIYFVSRSLSFICLYHFHFFPCLVNLEIQTYFTLCPPSFSMFYSWQFCFFPLSTFNFLFYMSTVSVLSIR